MCSALVCAGADDAVVLAVKRCGFHVWHGFIIEIGDAEIDFEIVQPLLNFERAHGARGNRNIGVILTKGQGEARNHR